MLSKVRGTGACASSSSPTKPDIATVHCRSSCSCCRFSCDAMKLPYFASGVAAYGKAGLSSFEESPVSTIGSSPCGEPPSSTSTSSMASFGSSGRSSGGIPRMSAASGSMTT